jgi:hypothetical protein
MRTHTTKAWTNAAIYFYAATAGGGSYQIDNVSVEYDSGLPANQTECIDPLAPSPRGGVDGPNLIANGDSGGHRRSSKF